MVSRLVNLEYNMKTIAVMLIVYDKKEKIMRCLDNLFANLGYLKQVN